MGNTNVKRNKTSKKEYGEVYERKPLNPKRVMINFSDVTERFGHSYTEEKISKNLVSFSKKESEFLFPNLASHIASSSTRVIFNINDNKIIVYKRNDNVEMIFPFEVMNEFIENEKL